MTQPDFRNFWGWPNWPTGTLKGSIRLYEIPLYRFQRKTRLEPWETWYWMYHDGNHKWEATDRYAARHTAYGHFFTLSPKSGISEIEHYGGDQNEYDRTGIICNLDNVLDLTNRETIQWFFESNVEMDYSPHWMDLIDFLLDQSSGGDTLTDFIGNVAFKLGYNGIATFGARSAQRHWPNPGEIDGRNRDLAGFSYDSMREDGNCINFMIFFGSNVVRSAKKVLLPLSAMPDGHKTTSIVNPYFEKPHAEIDRLFMDDPRRDEGDDLTFETLTERSRRNFWAPKPKIAIIRN